MNIPYEYKTNNSETHTAQKHLLSPLHGIKNIYNYKISINVDTRPVSIRNGSKQKMYQTQQVKKYLT